MIRLNKTLILIAVFMGSFVLPFNAIAAEEVKIQSEESVELLAKINEAKKQLEALKKDLAKSTAELYEKAAADPEATAVKRRRKYAKYTQMARDYADLLNEATRADLALNQSDFRDGNLDDDFNYGDDGDVGDDGDDSHPGDPDDGVGSWNQPWYNKDEGHFKDGKGAGGNEGGNSGVRH